MSHFTVEQWTDFARHLVSAEDAEKMKEHLASGCQRCIEAKATMQMIAEVAAREASYEPPAASVRSAKMLASVVGFETAKTRARSFLQLVFDSFSQPALAGVRGAPATSRKLLYRVADCCIDMTLEHQPGAKEMVLVGQILDSSRSDRNGGSLLVELMSAERVIA